MTFGFDVETIPNPEAIDKLPPPKAKTARLVDPTKIAKAIDDAREKQIEEAGLDPVSARVLAAGMVVDGAKQCKVLSDMTDDAEVEILEWILANLAKEDSRVVTFNGKGFDLPFVYKRAMILGVKHKAPPLPVFMKRYDTTRHVDMMQVWADNNSHEYISLEMFAKMVLGLEKGEMDFKEFPELMKTEAGRDKITEYCLQDASLAFLGFKAACGYLL